MIQLLIKNIKKGLISLTIWKKKESGIYVPEGPYIIQSGKNKGKSVELLMFSNYSLLNWIYEKAKENCFNQKNSLHRHLEWVMARGEDRKVQVNCPFCNQPATQFSIRSSYGYSFDSDYICCNSDECKSNLRSYSFEKSLIFKPIKFSSMNFFRSKTDQKKLGQIFKKVFVLPNRMTRNHAFQFFAS